MLKRTKALWKKTRSKALPTLFPSSSQHQSYWVNKIHLPIFFQVGLLIFKHFRNPAQMGQQLQHFAVLPQARVLSHLSQAWWIFTGANRSLGSLTSLHTAPDHICATSAVVLPPSSCPWPRTLQAQSHHWLVLFWKTSFGDPLFPHKRQ